MKHYTLPPSNEADCFEEPHIQYISRKAKGVYANILLDNWFKIIFSYPPFPSTSFADLIGESHHHGA